MARISTSTVATMTRVGDALETKRRERGMSQEDAGLELGRSQTAFHRYTTGRPVPLEIAPAVSRFLGLPIEQVREMILESHEEPASSNVKRSNAERMRDLETGLDELRAALSELLQPNGGAGQKGRRAPKR